MSFIKNALCPSSTHTCVPLASMITTHACYIPQVTHACVLSLCHCVLHPVIFGSCIEHMHALGASVLHYCYLNQIDYC
jgi:hypothetical protein